MPKDTAQPSDDLASVVGPDGKPEWAMSRRERARAAAARGGAAPPRRLWPWVALVLLLAAAAAAAYGWREGWLDRWLAPPAEAEASAEPDAPRPVQINQDEWATVEPRTLRRVVEVIGTLEPARRVDLSAETGGAVEEVLARTGDAVAAGEPLVRIDVERLTLERDLAQSNADAARAQLALAEEQLARSEALVERGLTADSTLDDARASVAQLRASLAAQEDQVRVAELALEGATVSAPFEGIVASRSVEPGAVVGAGAALMTLVNLDEMEMRAVAPVSAGPLVGPGQAVAIEVDGVEGRAFEGEVARIAPVAQEGTRSLGVFVSVGNEDGTLIGGMFGTGEVVVAEARDAIGLPAGAVREDGEGSHVLVIADGALARRPVTVGEAWDGDLVQVEGLEAGEAVVVAPLDGLEPGEAVELVEF